MSDSEVEISLVRDDLLFRIQRRIGLIPSGGLGVVRRAIFFALLAWLPIAVWAAYTVARCRAWPASPCSSTSASMPAF